MNRKRGGYAGIIAILLGTIILVYLYAHTYYFSAPISTIPEMGSMETTTTATGLESAHTNIDSAQIMKDKLNEHNTELNKAIGD